MTATGIRTAGASSGQESGEISISDILLKVWDRGSIVVAAAVMAAVIALSAILGTKMLTREALEYNISLGGLEYEKAFRTYAKNNDGRPLAV